MFPYIELFGRQLPTYGVLGVLAIVLGLLLSLLRCRRFGVARDDCAYIYVFGAIGALVGAKVLYLLTVLPDFLRDLPRLWSEPAWFLGTYISGGLVFYGGLIGALCGAWLTARFFSRRLREFFPVFIPVFPLIHAIGRMGCFAVGCCHGAEADWGIAFTHSPIAPNGVKLIPVQLFEAGALLIICLVLLWYSNRRPPLLRLLGLYFLTYAPVRFVLEYFRGDAVRGFLWQLSTSQWISIGILIAGGILMIMPNLPKKRTNNEYND